MERSPDGRRHGVAIGVVVDTQDPDSRGRVKVRLPAFDDELTVWARVAAPGAGGGRGAWLPPARGDEAVVVFEGGDPRQPVVVGALWSGKGAPPESSEGEWVIESPAGARLRFGKADGHALMLTTEGGNVVELRGDGAVLISDGSGCSVRLEGGNIVIEGGSTIDVTAAKVRFNAAVVEAAGVLKVDTLIANSVVASSHTPGVGNIW